MMRYFLAKTAPGTYSIDQLQKDHKTVWDGVSNPQAVRALREMKTGDKVFIYHSGGVSAIVGLAEVGKAGGGDPEKPQGGRGVFGFWGEVGPAGDAGGNQAVEAVRRLGA